MAVQGGPDSGYSWVIVVCCAYIHFALFGLFRSAGVMYVALIHNYNVTREEASWPFSLCAAVFQLFGPSAGVMTHYMTQRKTCILGAAVAAFGMSMCYFATNLLWINIFFGIVHGLGFGVIVTVVPVTLNQYFLKHRATAIGIAFAGGSTSSLIFPAFLKKLLETYTLEDSFLLIGGVVLNTLVAACLMKSPPWMDKPKKKQVVVEEGSEARDSGVSTSEDDSKKESIPSISATVDDSGSGHRESKGYLSPVKASPPKEVSQQDLSTSNNIEDTSDTLCSNNDSVLFDTTENKIENPEQKLMEVTHYEAGINEPLVKHREMVIVPKMTQVIDVDNPPKESLCRSLMGILKQPIFHFLNFSMIVYFTGIHSYFMVAVDFAKDQGIPEEKAIYIISMFSVTDLIGRSCLGWVTDKGFIRRKTLLSINFGILGVLYQLYPVVHSYTGVLILSSVCGISIGSSITLFFVLMAECLDIKKLTLVVGLTSFFNGLASLVRPLLIGLFRDACGSYNWMFHSIGIITLVFSMFWFFESWRTRDKKGKNKVHIVKS